MIKASLVNILPWIYIGVTTKICTGISHLKLGPQAKTYLLEYPNKACLQVQTLRGEEAPALLPLSKALNLLF